MTQLLALGCLALAANAKLNVRPFGPSPPKAYFQDVPMQSNFFSGGSHKDVVHSFMRNRGFSMEDYIIRNNYVSSHTKVAHFYLKQMVQGKQVFNGDININIAPDGTILSYGDSFYKPQPGSLSRFNARQTTFSSQPSQHYIGSVDALDSLLSFLDLSPEEHVFSVSHVSLEGEPFEYLRNVTCAHQDPKAMPGWIQLGDGTLEAVWNVQLDLHHDWFSAHISASDRRVKSLTNWVSRAEYTVFPLGTNDPNDGKRVKLYDPADKIASPLGWHDRGRGKRFTDTEGNNVIAGHLDDYYIPTHPGVDGGKHLVFDFPLDLKKEPESYINASITNLFYWCNTLHDLYYHYGFDEVAGNFQENNFGRGGRGDDAVVASAQDADGYDNANFATPPDGQRPRMNMYVWDMSYPLRDGDLEDGIITHEYSHGLSTRLTGGPANSDCLGWGEAGGMGEGWGDIIATLLRLNTSHTRNTNFGMGNYAAGRNIRKYEYSTNLTTNPETYKNLDRHSEVHEEGATWAVMLYEVYWNLADKLPFTPNWFPASKSDIPKFSNTLILQLLIDGMKLQPCSPSFSDARDAIIQADSILTKGLYKCPIWKAFAKRGLGVGARVHNDSPWGGGYRAESFKVPKDCQ